MKKSSNLQSHFSSWWFEHKKIIICTLTWGGIVNFQLYSNSLRSPDSLWNSGIYQSGTWELSLGRWFPQVFDWMQFQTILPFLNTLLTLFIYAIALALFTDFFNVQSQTLKLLCTCVIISSPFISMSLQYYYSNETYAFALLFAILSFYGLWDLHNISPKRLFAGIFSLTFSLALYQSFLGIAVLMALFLILKRASNENKLNIINFIKDIGAYAIILLGGILLYYILLQILLKYFNISLSSYKGANDISVKSILFNLPTSMLKCYSDFGEFFLGNKIARNAFNINYIHIAVILIIVGKMIGIIFNPLRAWVSKFIMLITFLCIPIACNFIDLITINAEMYLLTIGGMLIVIQGLVLLEEEFSRTHYFKSGIYCFLIILLYLYTIQDNVDSMMMLNTTNQSRTLVNRIWTNVENFPGYYPGTKIMIAGNPSSDTSSYPIVSNYYSYANWYARIGLFWSTWDGSTSCWNHLIQNELGINANFCTKDDFIHIANDYSFKEMPVYPLPGSISFYDDILVVKVSDITNMQY